MGFVENTSTVQSEVVEKSLENNASAAIEISIRGGRTVSVTEDEQAVYIAFCAGRSSDMIRETTLFRIVAYGRNMTNEAAREWTANVLRGLVEKDVFAICNVKGRRTVKAWRPPVLDAEAIEQLQFRNKKRAGVLKEHGHQCVYCGTNLRPSTISFTRVIPRQQGGGHGQENLRPTCPTCCDAKKSRTPEQWADDILASFKPQRRRFSFAALVAGLMAIMTR